MGMEVLLQKSAICPGAHKIGAAISGPKIAGKHFYGHEAFAELACRKNVASLSTGRQRVGAFFKNARVEKMPLNICICSGMREPLARRSAC